MIINIDILVQDNNWERVRMLYRKYPTFKIRKAITEIDFVTSLIYEPKLIILDKTTQLSKKHLVAILSERLTSRTSVIIWNEDEEYRQELTKMLLDHKIKAFCFLFDSESLWISIYNILKYG